MASFMTYHEVAQLKQIRRRNAAQKVGQSLAGSQLDALHEIGEKLFGAALQKTDSDKDYETVAIGYLMNIDSLPCLIIACKGIPAPDATTVLGVAQPYYELLQEQRIWILQDQTSVSGEANLHAEMAIVQFVRNQLGVSKGLLPYCGLQIACIKKGVCPDCSGWMTRHNIPHTWRRENVAKLGWVHPLTGTFFKYKGKELQYVKYLWNGFQPPTILDTAKSKVTHHPHPEKYQ